MKISLNWLKDFVEFDSKLSIDEIAWRLTEATAEIEGVCHIGEGLENVVVGELLETKKHPDADKLSVAKVKISSKDTIQVIYAQKAEVSIGDKLPTAVAPCTLPGGKVERGKIRGQMSEGMLCLDSELIEGAAETLTKFDKKAKVGTPITELLPLEDVVFEIDNHSITHRSDLFSHYGFARECVALGLAKWKKQIDTSKADKITGKKELPLKLHFKEKVCTKNYFSTVISNVSTKTSPDWVKARLAAIGIRSINAIVDISNLVMFEVGQPVHTFDLRLLEGKDVTHRLSKKDEEMTTLDGMKRKLNEETIIIEAGDEIVDLCGIMGGENSAIKDDTTDIYVHSCHYDNVLIRKAMISLGHRTDAGTIFEKNIDPERAEMGYARMLELFSELFPEAKFHHETFHYQQKTSPKVKVELPFAKIASHIGMEIDKKKAQQYLEDLGFAVKSKKESLEVDVPSWRATTVTIPEDVIEEIVRIHGFSKVPAIPPVVELATPVKNHKRHMRRSIQKFLTGLGFQEESNYSFLPESLLGKVGITDLSEMIEIANPVTDDFRFMRPSFLPYMLNNLSRNQLIEQRTWKTFETGAVYTRSGKEVTEEHLLTLIIATPKKETAFSEVRTLCGQLFHELALELELQSAEGDLAYPGRSLQLQSDGKTIGQLYDLHPMIAENFKLSGSITVVEINLDELYQIKPKEILYQQLNRNPRALLDINVVVDEKKMVAEVENIIHSVESEYLQHSKLVDVYQGESLGKGKKSFTFALSYQHPQRTLEEKEIQDILDKLIKALEKDGGVVRR